MKNIKTFNGSIARVSLSILTFALVIVPQFTLGQSELTTTFTNNTGRTVNDLHIQYNHDVSITQSPKTFNKVSGTNLKKLTKGTVAPGGSVEITAKRESGDLDINKWWWTNNGKRVGNENTGCSSPDCDNSRSGDSNMDNTYSDTLEGVVTLEVKTDKGPIKLRLPADMRAGDTISGTVIDERKDTADEVAEIEINGQKHQLYNKILTFVVPTAASTLPLVFRSKAGQKVANLDLPVNPSSTVSPGTFQLPTLGQQGHPVTIAGPFDGDISNTKCALGDQPIEKIAESPRMAAFESPKDVIGLSEIKLNEGNEETKGDFRNIGVNLSAPKTKLLRTEQTTVTLTVKVGQDLTSPVPVNIVSTGSINMQGGNFQTIEIQPNQVGSDGTFTKAFLLTATQAGAFGITARVTQPNPAIGTSNCECKCEFSTPAILTAGKSFIKGGGTENSFEPNVKTSCNGNRCEIQNIAYSWSVGAASTATYSVHQGTDKVKKLVVDVTKSGKLELTVTVTVTCSDGTSCTATGSKTFDVKK